jgi:hypothetical protein
MSTAPGGKQSAGCARAVDDTNQRSPRRNDPALDAYIERAWAATAEAVATMLAVDPSTGWPKQRCAIEAPPNSPVLMPRVSRKLCTSS